MSSPQRPIQLARARKATLEKLRDQLTAWKKSNGYPL